MKYDAVMASLVSTLRGMNYANVDMMHALLAFYNS